MISFDCDAWDDDVEDGRRQLEEYELYIYEQDYKSRVLLSRPDALVLARPFAGELAKLVLQHAKSDGMATLAEMIRDSICEDVLVKALEGRTALLPQPFSRDGYIAIRKTLDAACRAFEALLTAEEGLPAVERDAK